MPTYDYSCDCCHQVLEIFQKITEPPLKKCPQCQKDSLRRGVGGGLATFRFVGEGFYINDAKKECSSKTGKCCPCDQS